MREHTDLQRQGHRLLSDGSLSATLPETGLYGDGDPTPDYKMQMGFADMFHSSAPQRSKHTLASKNTI